jgi:Protein of unknown function (DUF4058)
MAMIFPGMDPYLEDPHIWPGVHNRFIVYLSDYLQPLLRPRYVAAVEERVFVAGPDRDIIPDVWLKQRRAAPKGSATSAVADSPELERVATEVHESFVEILDLQTNQRVVTVIDLLSPTNKYAGRGRELYESKQREVLRSESHLVEIDLLRTGPHVLAVPELIARKKPYAYLVCVSRAVDRREVFELYRRRLRDRLPNIRVPLAGDDPDVVLDIQAVLAETYDRGDYRDRLAYSEACNPPLSATDQEWASRCAREGAAE